MGRWGVAVVLVLGGCAESAANLDATDGSTSSPATGSDASGSGSGSVSSNGSSGELADATTEDAPGTTTTATGEATNGCDGGPPIHCALESLTAPYIDTDGAPGRAIGLVVGVQTAQGRYVAGFGARAPGGRMPPATDAMLELASIGKVYTGYLLADALQRGEVTLMDTLEDTFSSPVPTFDGQSINLLDLATHTSSLPDYPTNVPNPSPINPMDGYTLQMLEAFYASHELEAAPGSFYRYSNLGSGTLGHILTLAAGAEDYDALARERITEPRGFVDTVVDMSPSQEARWMQMYQDGEPIPPLAMGEVLYGGGILRSTADEVLDFFEDAMAGDDPTWALVLDAYRPGAPGSAMGFQIAVEDLGDRTRYSKGGASAGMVMFTSETLVYVQTNVRGVDGLRMMAAEILDGVEGVAFE